MQTIANVRGLRIHNVFSCDIWSGSQKWLQSLGMKVILNDMNMRIWKDGVITTKDVQGKACRIRMSDKIDIYVCGFMCTPFTPNGQRKEWADEHSKTFFSAVKTIATLRPRVAVLENVMAISNNSNSEVVKQALSNLRGYIVLYLKVNTSDVGVPHHRVRIYMVAFRTDALKAIFTNKPRDLLEKFLQQKVNQCGHPCESDFVPWLSSMGYPVVKSMRSKTSKETPQCNCTGPQAICELHPCRCPECGQHGEKSRRCVWRRTHRMYMKSVKFVLKRREHLAAWRTVKKDKTIKRVPSYFDMAAARGLDVEVVKQRSRRDLLDISAQEGNIMANACVLHFVQVIGAHAASQGWACPYHGPWVSWLVPPWVRCIPEH